MKKEKLKYPIYIPSLGRARNQLTVRLLEANGIDNYFIIVEHKEFNEYCKYDVNSKNVLSLPDSNYGTSTVARNFALAHSKKNGFAKHWQLDDDISKIYEHLKGKVIHTNVLKVMAEVEAIDEASNSSITGINTSASFLSQNDKDFNFNGSLTSMYLITNNKFKFRGMMLVDMDYQLQVLRAGFQTLRCNNYAFVFKTPLKAKGGYYDIYSNDEKRRVALEEFFTNNPDVERGIKRSSAGFLVAANISKIWRRFKPKNSPNEGQNSPAEPSKGKSNSIIESGARKQWRGMPEFKQEEMQPYQRVVINLVDAQAALRFFKLIGQAYTKKTRSIWFPEVDEEKYIDKRYSDKKKSK